jgi:peptide deformylase
MYQLIEEASQVLRTPPPEFDFENPPEDPAEITKNLAEAMEKFGGLGLSANQVGLPYRLFVMRTMQEGDEESKVLPYFNPKLTRVSQDTDLMKEGCLSFPDLFLMIKRSKTIEFTYQDETGEEKSAVLEGIGARCVQHEIDHLNGILFLQRASRLKLERAQKARVKERKKRLEYERRIALARYFQEMQSTKDDSESNDTGTVSTDDRVSQES